MIEYFYISLFIGISFNSPETREEYKYVPESPWSIIHQEIFRLRRASPTSRLQDFKTTKYKSYCVIVLMCISPKLPRWAFTMTRVVHG